MRLQPEQRETTIGQVIRAKAVYRRSASGLTWEEKVASMEHMRRPLPHR